MTQQPENVSAAFPNDVGLDDVGLAQAVPPAVLHLKSAVASGAPWTQALLEAIGLWTLPQEVHQGRTYQYLIQGEALDWLLLAERLCGELDGLMPPDAKDALLFTGQLPPDVSPETFRRLIGATKHRAYLNYWYGVVLEEALQLAVEEEVRKRHRARCYPDSEDLVEEAFPLLYSKDRAALWEEFSFKSEKTPAPFPNSLPGDPLGWSLSDVKEFTYWLFKHRVNLWDPARVASDTRKAMQKLSFLETIQAPMLEPVVDLLPI